MAPQDMFVKCADVINEAHCTVPIVDLDNSVHKYEWLAVGDDGLDVTATQRRLHVGKCQLTAPRIVARQ